MAFLLYLQIVAPKWFTIAGAKLVTRTYVPFVYDRAYFKTIYTIPDIFPLKGIEMKFSDLTEDQWEYIKCFLPPQPRVGRKRAEDRRTINGILDVLETGCKWEDMRRLYGS